MTLTPEDGTLRSSGLTPNRDSLLSAPVNTKDLAGLNAADSAALAAELAAAAIKQREDNELVAWANTQYEKCRAGRSPFERQWYLNIAFYSGKQYVAPVEVPNYGFRLVAPKAPAHRVRLVVNKIRPIIRTECSKLTSSKPIPTVVPATNEDEDVSAAAVGDALLSAEFANAHFNKVYKSWIWWGSITGVSFIKQYWDPRQLDYDAMQMPPMPTMPDGTPYPADVIEQVKDQMPEVKRKLETPIPAQGKICRERLTPFQVYVPDLLAEDIEDQPYVIQVDVKTPQWVKNRYGFTPNCDARGANSVLDTVSVIAKNSQNPLDAVLVKEVWVKPNMHYLLPEGGLLIIINQKLVYRSDKWPLPFKEYPFYKYDGIPSGGFYGVSVVEDLIPLQKEYNRTRSQALEIKNQMGKPKVLYPEGSIDIRKVNTEVGQGIPYKSGYEKPSIMPPVDVPSTYLNEIGQLYQEFDDISGQHEISRGQTSSQLGSGSAIAFLQEQDDTKLHYQVSSIEDACEKLGQHYLQYVVNYWEKDRIIKVVGINNNYEALHWKKGSLRGNTDVKVQTGSALPQSKAARQAFITEWMQNGFIPVDMGMEILNLGMFDKAVDDLLVDKKQAMRENLRMSDMPDGLLDKLLSPYPGPNGEPPFELPSPHGPGMPPVRMNGDGTPFQPQPPVPVNSWDDHQAHLQWHNHYRKTQQYEMLSDAKKKAFELHVQAHQFAMMSQQMNAFGQPLTPGMAPGGNGGPPGQEGDPAATQGQPDPANGSYGEASWREPSVSLNEGPGETGGIEHGNSYPS